MRKKYFLLFFVGLIFFILFPKDISGERLESLWHDGMILEGYLPVKFMALSYYDLGDGKKIIDYDGILFEAKLFNYCGFCPIGQEKVLYINEWTGDSNRFPKFGLVISDVHISIYSNYDNLNFDYFKFYSQVFND